MTNNVKSLGLRWLIVCCHLVNKPEQRWNDITNEDGVTEGYLCDDCDLAGPQEVPVTKLEPLAAERVNELRERWVQ